MTIWELPGPAGFVESVERSLRDGVNVVVRFPGAMPDGFSDVVTRNARRFLTTNKFECTRFPLKSLREKYVPNGLFPGDSVQRLCENEAFRGRLIWLEGLNDDLWPEWREFLSRYAEASRSIPTLGRTLFIAPLEGEPPGDPPQADVTMAVHDWSEVVDEMDLLFFAHNRLPERRMELSQRLLLATTVAHVACWDIDTADRMLNEAPHVILEPYEMLRSLAKEKHWTSETPSNWQLGTASGSGVAHAALAVLTDPPREIRRRLWSAQASVLLPRIESHRHVFVERNWNTIERLSYRAGNGVKDPYDAELGELLFLFQHGSRDRATHRFLSGLRDARNALAHLEPLPPGTALELAQLDETSVVRSVP